MDGAQLLPEGHYWSEYVRTDDPLWIGLRSSLIGFASIGPGFTPQFVGTGFVIATSGDGFLLVLTAKHVIADGVIEVQKPYSRRAPSAPDILFEPEQPLIGPKELRAVWMGADCADMLLVRHVSYAHNLDVALCVLEAQPELSAKIHKLAPAIALDTAVPSIGSWINVVSLSGFEFSGCSPKADGNGVWKVTNRPLMRVGKVISHEEAGMRHRGPCFRISVPLSGGMSGGFAYVPRDGSPIAACGIVSASAEEDDKQNDFRITGNSLMLGVIGALALPLPGRGAVGKDLLIHALRNGEIIDVAGGAKNLEIRRLDEHGACEIRRTAVAD